MLAAGLALPVAGCGAPDDRIVLRWWSPQAAPAQARAYRAQIKTFEAANPRYRVLFEPTSDDGYPAQFAAAFAAGQVPNLVSHLPSFAAQTYYAQGLLAPMDPVIAAIGADRFLPDANRPYLAPDGRHAAIGIGSTAVDMLWVRRELMAEAGITAIPRTWDQLRAAARAMQKGAVYGAPLPYGSNSMTSLVFVGFVHRAGGQIFSPDLDLVLDSPATYAALDFYRSMREFCPPGATSFGWADSLNAFVSGATATGIYGGRVLINIARQNPRIAQHLACVPYPTIDAQVPHWTFNDFPSLFMPKQAPHQEATRALAASLYDPEGYVRQLLAAPGHVLPVIKGITDREDYRGNTITTTFAPEIAAMTAAASAGHNLGYESPAHRPNVKAGEIIASNALAELVQRVVLAGENPRAAVARASRAIEAIMRR
ncbi:ABC transporter substrate-binding protein [Sphingomonas baiyangensis]|uniref:ABC transporter substrate-binding protein n=1 Tax=Sphingomonas baiyangensis TaxID=2572576 RepID=UPI00146DCF7F|nr:ABC transporter substrate-binding protein [Sphingomonas baiyangensis]